MFLRLCESKPAEGWSQPNLATGPHPTCSPGFTWAHEVPSSPAPAEHLDGEARQVQNLSSAGEQAGPSPRKLKPRDPLSFSQPSLGTFSRGNHP